MAQLVFENLKDLFKSYQSQTLFQFFFQNIVETFLESEPNVKRQN